MKTSRHERWHLMSMRTSLGTTAVVAAAILIVLSVCPDGVSAEGPAGTNFYLKVSKSIPRIGRRSELDNFFLKASKSVPRIGRRRELSPLTEGRDWGVLPWFRQENTVPGPSRRSDYYLHEESQPLSWSNVEKTMEESPELWKPDIWRKNNENIPLKDEYDLQHVERRSAEPLNNGNTNKMYEEGRSQPEV